MRKKAEEVIINLFYRMYFINICYKMRGWMEEFERRLVNVCEQQRNVRQRRNELEGSDLEDYIRRDRRNATDCKRKRL